MLRRWLLPATIGAFAAPGSTLAQGRAVRLVVPYAAGGGSDVQARLLAQALAPRLGLPVVVENRAGAGSQIGAEHVARAALDGLTLLFADVPLVIVPAVMGVARAGYDPIRDFAPVARVGTAPPVLWTRMTAP